MERLKTKKKKLFLMYSWPVCVGVAPDGSDYHFPVQTVVRFDYCFKDGEQTDLLSSFDSPKVVCKLNETEYENLIYAMYKSDDTPEKYKPHFEKILFDLGKKKKATS